MPGGTMNIMTVKPDSAAVDIAAIAEETSAGCIATRVRQLSRIVTRVYDEAMRPLGITASQFTLLTQLAQQDAITAVEIGFTLDIEKSTLSRNLRSLERAGLVEIAIVEEDLRRRAVWLTERGARQLAAALPAWRRAQAILAEVVKPRDVRTIATASATLTAADGGGARGERRSPLRGPSTSP